MSRRRELLTLLVILGPIWLYLVLGIGPGAYVSPVWHDVIMALPLYLLITFGCYSLATVGYNVYRVRSDDGAADSLRKDIDEAKLDLRKKGFNFEQ